MSRFPEMEMFEREPDDVDRLFARLDTVDVPPGLTEHVLARTVRRASPQRSQPLWPWVLLTVACLAALVAFGYATGAALASGDGLSVVDAARMDGALVLSAPGDFLAVLVNSLPWALVVVAGVCAAALTWAASQVAVRLPAVLGGRHSQALG